MTEPDNILSLLTRRKLTRAIADVVRTQVTEYLTTLAPLFRPHTIFGDHIEGGNKGSVRRADQALKDVQTVYDAVAPIKPFNLRRELSPPFTFSGASVELTPVDYVYVPESVDGARRITVRRPLTWTLSYAGFAPSRLPELLDPRVRGEELQRFILSYLLLQQVVANQPGLTRMLDALHFPISTGRIPELGDLPVTLIGTGVATERPSDAVVVESADLTGMDSFEEVVRIGDIPTLRDSLKDRLLDVARELVPQSVAP